MIKRIIGPLLGTLLLAAAFALGYLCHRNEWLPQSLRDAWHTRSGNNAEQPPDDLAKGAWSKREAASTSQEQWEQLAAVGYAGSTGTTAPHSGVVKNLRDRVSPGLNLSVSGHAPEASLFDSEGKVLHTWSCTFSEAWPNQTLPPAAVEPTTHHWRRARLLPNGDLLAIFSGIGLIKLDKNSHLLWKHDGHSHHDLDIAQSGDIYVLDCEARLIPEISPDQLCVEDFVTVLSSDGVVKQRVSLLDCFKSSDYASCLDKMPSQGDLFHTNTLEVFDGSLADKSPLFKEGNCLVSLFKLNTIAIIDMNAKKVVWTSAGMWTRQHQPTLLPTGNLLIFDNQGLNGRSKIIEFNPFSQNVVWAYRDTPQTPLYSKLCGSCQRLPNGNTLITESMNGRAIEVTPAGETVWEYINPHESGDNNEFIAVLFEVVRLDPSFPTDWL